MKSTATPPIPDCYRVVHSKSCADIELNVRKHLINGWHLAGGIAFDPTDQEYLQAVYRPDDLSDAPDAQA